MGIDVAVSGDAIVNRRVSVCQKDEVQDLLSVFTEADVAFTHCEMLFHDYMGDEVYPAAEAGGTWMRAPPYVAEEFREIGIDLVSHASNHALDYSYGGLYSTWDALTAAGIPFAGTGRDLAEATDPTYLDAAGARVGLVSMTTSFANWNRAGETRRDVGGRPGVNPLRYQFRTTPEQIETLIAIAKQMGWWVSREGHTWLFNPPGNRNTGFRFAEDEDLSEGEMTRDMDPLDQKRNLRAITEANNQADVVLAHIHTHEWAGDDLSASPDFLPPFARACIENGADIVICQGSHSPLRGIELYDGCPIFYDPGDLFLMSDTTEKLPADFYYRYAQNLNTPIPEATPSEGLESRGLSKNFDLVDDDSEDDSDYLGGEIIHPPGGNFSAPVSGNLIPVCTFTETFDIDTIQLHPGELLHSPQLYAGVPQRVTGERATEILQFVEDISEDYGTSIEISDDIGHIEVSS